MAEQARLVGVENDREITKEDDDQFLFQYQRAVLLALKDKGILNEIQFRYAEEALRKQQKQFKKE